MTEAQFELMSGPTLPLATRIALLLTFAFLFLGAKTTCINRVPLLALSMPVWWGLAATFLAIADVAAAESVIPGGGRRAAAAGIAEAHLPATWAFVVVAAMSFRCAWAAPRTSSGEPSSLAPSERVVPLLLALTLAADVWVSHQVMSASGYLVSRVHAAVALGVGTALIGIVAGARSFGGRGARVGAAPKIVTVTIGVTASIVACTTHVIARALQRFAMGP